MHTNCDKHLKTSPKTRPHLKHIYYFAPVSDRRCGCLGRTAANPQACRDEAVAAFCSTPSLSNFSPKLATRRGELDSVGANMVLRSNTIPGLRHMHQTSTLGTLKQPTTVGKQITENARQMRNGGCPTVTRYPSRCPTRRLKMWGGLKM